MNPVKLVGQVEQLLTEIQGINVELEEPQIFQGSNFDELMTSWRAGDDNNVIHKAGVYILGSDTKVFYIGEGGASKDAPGGTIGHRVFQHLNKKSWRNQVRVICLLPISPREFSKLGEQLALAAHFQSQNGNLPIHQKCWR